MSIRDTIVTFHRNGLELALRRISEESCDDERSPHLLCAHGLTYSSHQFDTDVRDISFARHLARSGIVVWLLDLTGYGRSAKPENGFTVDSDYASCDIEAAVRHICKLEGRERINVLGWSWGTITASRFAARSPQLLDRLVLYAPIMHGLGACNVTESFKSFDPMRALEDFQTDGNGQIDLSIVSEDVLACYSRNCALVDGAGSPNGARRDLMQDPSVRLVDLSPVCVPTLVIAGDCDPYVDHEALQGQLTDWTRYCVVPGAGHAMIFEEPFYRTFRETVLGFLCA